METLDADLVRQTVSGSHQAFDVLMVRYQKLIYQVAYSFYGNTEDAMDVCQDVFLQAHQKMAMLEQPGKVKAWLVRMTYNRCISLKRSAQELWSPLDDDEFVSQDDPQMEHQNKTMISRCLAVLNPKQKLAVVLKYLEGYSLRELSQTMDISEDQVKNMLYRSIRKMAASARESEGAL